ncbi:MAG: 30S ribosomal protein S8 [Candidatus Diapherotrites archaeon]
MSQIDPIADALVSIQNSENASKRKVIVKPGSKLIHEILRVMKEKGYIADFEVVKERHKTFYTVGLQGKINKVAAIKPRYAVKKDDFERYEKRFLPARDIGTIIVSTSQGVMTHAESKEKSIGGRLLAYIY